MDLHTLARSRSAAVTLIKKGIYETERAQAAGRAAVHEVFGEEDPALKAVRRGIAHAACSTLRALF